MKTLLLTDNLRQQLKSPFGMLITGSFDECTDYLKSKATEVKPPRLILVGDTVSRNAMQRGLDPDVIVIDNKEMRHSSAFFIPQTDRRRLNLFNAQGSIDSASWDVIDQAIKIGNSVVIVEGEEDLLALVAISVAPEGSLVVYGQPNEGIVLVTVTSKKKREIADILARMTASTSI